MSVIDRLIEADTRSPRRILVIGDSMDDVYILGRLEDKCQEGCVKFVEEGRVVVPGGAANAARSLSEWRTNVIDLDTPITSIKNRYMVKDRCVFRHDFEYSPSNIKHIHKEALWAAIQEETRIHAVLLSDYNKGTLTPQFISDVENLCKARNIPCVADAKQPPEVYTGCILKCNRDYQSRHMDKLKDMMYGSWVKHRIVITDGDINPVFWDGGSATRLGYALPPVPCVNHVGAGDCFAAHLTLSLAYGLSLREAVSVAHSAGRVYVQQPHNKPPTPQAIREDMETGKG